MYYSILLTCQFIIALSFLISCITKLRSRRASIEAVRALKLLPDRMANGAAIAIIALEASVAVAVFIWPFPAFLLSATLLLVFSLALLSVIRRNLVARCYCFGVSEEPISVIDVIRSGGLLVVSAIGVFLTDLSIGSSLSRPNVVFGLAGFVGAAFVLIWINLGEVFRLFNSQSGET